MRIDNSPARGMRDLLPADVAVRDHVLGSISAVYRRFGYQRIETPALENIARLQSGEGGDNEKLIFEVLQARAAARVPGGDGRGAGRSRAALRPDGAADAVLREQPRLAAAAVPVAADRTGVAGGKAAEGPVPAVYQCDIDIIGEPSVLAKAELIEATSEALAVVGLTGTTIRVSDRRFLSALAADCGVPPEAYDAFFITLDKLDKIGWDGVQAELAELGFPPERVAAVTEKIQGLTDMPATSWRTRWRTACPDWPPR